MEFVLLMVIAALLVVVNVLATIANVTVTASIKASVYTIVTNITVVSFKRVVGVFKHISVSMKDYLLAIFHKKLRKQVLKYYNHFDIFKRDGNIMRV